MDVFVPENRPIILVLIRRDLHIKEPHTHILYIYIQWQPSSIMPLENFIYISLNMQRPLSNRRTGSMYCVLVIFDVVVTVFVLVVAAAVVAIGVVGCFGCC